jgi:hypothetical protein
MTRYSRLKDWPDRLQKASREELARELAHWKMRAEQLGHRAAKKEALQRARLVEQTIHARFPDD